MYMYQIAHNKCPRGVNFFLKMCLLQANFESKICDFFGVK